MKAFEVCSNTANFIPELRALQTSVGHMLSPHGLFWVGAESTPSEVLTGQGRVLIHEQNESGLVRRLRAPQPGRGINLSHSCGSSSVGKTKE